MSSLNNSVLFVGRFQPLHLGHISVIDWLQHQGITNIIIGIGSSQYQTTAENPLSFEVRKLLWETVYPSKAMPIIALPDIHDDEHWIEHITKLVYTVCPLGFQQIVSNNAWVQRLATEAGIPVLIPPQTLDISATTIRQLIRQHDDTWKQYVPVSLHEIIARQNPAFEAGA